MKALQDDLRRLRRKGLYRRRRPLESAQSTQVVIEGRRYLSFCSNDYLGLSNDPRVVAALRQGCTRYGAGAGASPLISGYSIAHARLEEELADFLCCERVILFSSGYMANLGLQSALFNRHWHLFADRLNHASLIDAARYSGVHMLRYRNRDMDHLQARLQTTTARKRAIVSDGVFSMDGAIAPLRKLIGLSKMHDCSLLIDDAHGIGVLGAQGRGSFEVCQQDLADCTGLTGTLGKAFGTAGAFIATTQDVAEYLLQKARTLIYSTALPPAIAHASRASLEIIRTEPLRREQLNLNVQRFRSGARQLGLPIVASQTPIQAMLLGDNATALATAERLEQHGLLVIPIRPPTVPEGTARLRITFSANHTSEEIDRLLDALSTINTDLSESSLQTIHLGQ